jgi:predicted dienelactone hydrolase
MMALRRFLPLALAAGVAAALATSAAPAALARAAAPAATATPLQPTLPAPTGPDVVGTVSLHLVQAGRPDPWVPGRTRELMISLWYPARHAGRYPAAPYMEPGAWASLEHNQGIPASVVVPQTAGHQGAPVARQPGGLPVILYSPGSQEDRSVDTVLVEDLASRGYLVATIDHTYSDDEVEFPGGRVAQRVLPPDETRQELTDEVAERVNDTRFVLDELTAIDHGINPDADHHPLPAGLRGALNLSKAGMFGHSLGGATAAAAMLADPRIKAGMDMDGTLLGPVVIAGLNRPFMLLSSEGHNRDNDGSWAQFWNASTGWKRDFRLLGSLHLSYTDAEVVFPQTASAMGLPPDQLAHIIGTINPARAITVESAYVDAFFNQQLRHHPGHLLDGPSPRFPEMVFVP